MYLIYPSLEDIYIIAQKGLFVNPFCKFYYELFVNVNLLFPHTQDKNSIHLHRQILHQKMYIHIIH